MNPVAATVCVLEPLMAAHASEMFEVLSDPAIYEFENEPPASVDALRDRYRRLEARRSADGRQVWLNWVLRLPDGHLAGYVQATVLQDGSAYIAYELGSRYWRRGIGSCAVGAMLVELKSQYTVSLAVAVLKAQNHRSRGLLQKLGFQRASPEDEARWRDSDDEVAFTMSLDEEAHAA
ncbi:GNAT family N-acetyltransferase [Ideonella oryzae]|nr:GNAT family N-acetyltransferase [Ideonella oryzae]